MQKSSSYSYSSSRSRSPSRGRRSADSYSDYSSSDGETSHRRPAASKPAPKVVLHVRNLTRNVNADHLHEIFGIYGSVLNVELAVDHAVSLPKGYAFVEYASRELAEAAIEHMDGGQIDSNQISVSVVGQKAGGRDDERDASRDGGPDGRRGPPRDGWRVPPPASGRGCQRDGPRGGGRGYGGPMPPMHRELYSRGRSPPMRRKRSPPRRDRSPPRRCRSPPRRDRSPPRRDRSPPRRDRSPPRRFRSRSRSRHSSESSLSPRRR